MAAAASTTRTVRIVVDGRPARDGANTVKRSLQDIDDAAQRTEARVQQFGSALTALKAALVGVGVVSLVREIVQLADAWSLVVGRLSLVTSSTLELKQVQEQLYQVAQQTRSGLVDTADLYARLARATRDVKVTQGELIDVTKAVAQALRISNASTQESAAAMTQLGQALGSGKLAGDEFRSLAENAPRLMQALADALGKPQGALKQLAADGKLTAQVVIDALKAQAKAIDSEFGRIPVTVEQGLTVARNAIVKFIGDADQAGGASRALAGAIASVGQAFEDPDIKTAAASFATSVAAGISRGLEALGAAARTVRDNFNEIAAALALFAAARVVSLIQAITVGLWGMVAAGVAFAATPFGAVVTALAAAAAGVVYFRDQVIEFKGQTATVWDYVVSALRGIASLLIDVGDDGVDTAGRMARAFGDGVQDMLVRFTGLTVGILKNLDTIIGMFVGTFRGLTAVVTEFAGIFGTIWDEMIGRAGRKVTGMGEAFSLALSGNFSEAWATLDRAMQDTPLESLEQFPDRILNSFTTAFQSAAGAQPLTDAANALVTSVNGILERWAFAAGQLALNRWFEGFATSYQLEAANLVAQDAYKPKPAPRPTAAGDAKAGKGIASYYDQQTAALTKQLETFLQLDDAAENFYSTVERGGKKLTQQQAQELAALQATVQAFKALDKAGKDLQSAMDAIAKSPFSGATADLVKLIEKQREMPAAVKKARDELAKAKVGTEAHEKAQAKLRQEIERFEASGASFEEGLRNIREELQAGTDTLRASVEEQQHRARVLDLEIDGSDEARQALQALTRQRALDVVQQERERDLAPIRRQIDALEKRAIEEKDESFKRAADTLREYVAQRDKLYDGKAAADVAILDKERLKADADEAREVFQEPFKEAARSIQSALADTFENVFRGGIKSFSDLGQAVLDIFIKLAAQIAALLVFRPIVGGVLSSLGASDSFMRSLGIAPGTGGASGGSGLSLPGMSLFGGNGSGTLGGGVDWLFGEGTWSGLSNWYNTPWITSGANTANLGGSYLGADAVFGPGSAAANTATGAMSTAPTFSFGPANVMPVVGAGLSIFNATQNPNIGTIGGAAFSTAGAIASMFPAFASFGPWGMAIGAVLSLLGNTLFKKKPSNLGAEFSFGLDEGYPTLFEGTKHDDQRAFTKSFAGNLQEALEMAEARYGVRRATDGTALGTTYGREQGSHFFYDAGARDGDTVEGRATFKFEPDDKESIQKAAEGAIVAAIKDGFVAAGEGDDVTQAGQDLAIAMANSVAETFEQLDKDVAFAKAFDDFVQLGQGTFDPVAASYRKAVEEGKTYAASIVEQGRTFKQQALDLGLGAEELEGGLTRADVATRGYILSLFDQETGLSSATLEIVKQKAAIAQLETELQQFNITAEEAAEIAAGLTQELKDGFVNGLKAELNELDGAGFINTFDQLIAKFGEQSDMAFLLSETEAELASNMDLVSRASDRRIQAFVAEIAATEGGAQKLLMLRDHAVDAGWGTDVFDNALVALGYSLDDIANGTITAANAIGGAADYLAGRAEAISLGQIQASLTGRPYVPASATDLVLGAIGDSNALFNQLGQGISPNFFATIDTLLAKARGGSLSQTDLDAFTGNVANQFSYKRWTPQELGAIAQAVGGLLRSSDSLGTGTDSGTGGGGGAANDNRGRIDDLEELAKVHQDAASAAERLADGMRSAADSLRLYRQRLLTSSALNPNNLGMQLREAERLQQAAYLRVLAGGPDAIDAARELEQISDTVLELGKQVYGGGPEYVTLFNRTLAMVEQAEAAALTFEQQQIALATAANAELTRIRDEIAGLRGDLSSSPGSPGNPSNPGTPTNPGGPTQPPSYAFGYTGLGRQQGESADTFLRRFVPGQAASIAGADGIISEAEGYNWSISPHPIGLRDNLGAPLTNAGYFAAARAGGYLGPFTAGGHLAALQADSSGGMWRSFIDQLRKRAVVRAGFFDDYGAPQGYALGGLVSGGIAGMDSVRALLTPGEYVLPPRLVDQIGVGQLDAWRAGQPLNDNSQIVPPLVDAFDRNTAQIVATLEMIEARLAQIEDAIQDGNHDRREGLDEARNGRAQSRPRIGGAPRDRDAA